MTHVIWPANRPMTFSRPISLRVRSSERHLRAISRSYIALLGGDPAP